MNFLNEAVQYVLYSCSFLRSLCPLQSSHFLPALFSVIMHCLVQFVHMLDLFNLKSKIKEQPDLGQRENSECECSELLQFCGVLRPPQWEIHGSPALLSHRFLISGAVLAAAPQAQTLH